MSFLTRLPTRQDGVEIPDKVYLSMGFVLCRGFVRLFGWDIIPQLKGDGSFRLRGRFANVQLAKKRNERFTRICLVLSVADQTKEVRVLT